MAMTDGQALVAFELLLVPVAVVLLLARARFAAGLLASDGRRDRRAVTLFAAFVVALAALTLLVAAAG